MAGECQPRPPRTRAGKRGRCSATARGGAHCRTGVRFRSMSLQQQQHHRQLLPQRPRVGSGRKRADLPRVSGGIPRQGVREKGPRWLRSEPPGNSRYRAHDETEDLGDTTFQLLLNDVPPHRKKPVRQVAVFQGVRGRHVSPDVSRRYPARPAGACTATRSRRRTRGGVSRRVTRVQPRADVMLTRPRASRPSRSLIALRPDPPVAASASRRTSPPGSLPSRPSTATAADGCR